VRLLGLAAVALALAACAPGAMRSEPALGQQTFERQILLTIRQPTSLAVGLTGVPSQRYLQRRYGAAPTVERVLRDIAKEHSLDRVDGWPIESLGVYCEVLKVPEPRNVDAVIGQLATDPRVDLVQRMNLFETQSTRYDDPYVELQSAAAELEIERAHDSATGRGVSVAIIDSAVDATHPDLRDRVRLTRNLVTANIASRGGEIHGTAVAGIIASAVNNHEGIIGIAPDVSIEALRACWAVAENDPEAHCSTFSLARALEVALSLKPNVVNLSLAGPEDPLLGRLLDEITARGIVVVAAQPETSDAAQSFPSSHHAVLSARAPTQPVLSDSPFVLPAPAREVLTTIPGASYAFLSGNSLAAAHTSGVIALLMERRPELDAERIAAILTASTTVSAAGTTINACRALADIGSPLRCAAPPSVVRF